MTLGWGAAGSNVAGMTVGDFNDKGDDEGISAEGMLVGGCVEGRSVGLPGMRDTV